MSVLRILHVAKSLDPAAGGPPVICWNLARFQASLGHLVTILAESASSAFPTVEGVAIRSIGACPVRERWFGGHRTRTVRAILRDTDVVHMHGIWDTLLTICGREGERAGLPYFIAPHGMLDAWNLRQKRLKKRIALSLGTRHLLNAAAAIHQTYPEEQQSMSEAGVFAPGIVVPNGVNLTEIDPIPEPGEFRATVPALGDSPYLLFLGRLHHKKGLDYLGDAFARLAPQFPNLQLVVAGPDEGDETPFREQCRRLGIESRVHMVGPVYGSRKWSALAGAECFCLPSRQEGFSVAVLEAMACRCPVVISDQCHFPQVAESGAGSVVYLDSAAIADAIAGIVSDPQRGKECGRNGRALIESVYTWERVSQQLVDHYHTHLRRQPR